MSKQNILQKIEKLLDENSETVSLKQKTDVPFEVGKAYFFRTVTYFATGRVKEIIGNFLILEDAAWIAYTGRFSDAIAKGVLDEVEPVEVSMYLNVNSLTDAFDWNKDLPREQK